jgi:hypothetical protein
MNEATNDSGRLEKVLEDLARMREVANLARGTESDPSSKWEANSILVRWMRNNCFTIMSALEAGGDGLRYPSGNAKQQLYRSLMELDFSLE